LNGRRQCLFENVRPAGIEPATCGLEGDLGRGPKRPVFFGNERDFRPSCRVCKPSQEVASFPRISRYAKAQKSKYSFGSLSTGQYASPVADRRTADMDAQAHVLGKQAEADVSLDELVCHLTAQSGSDLGEHLKSRL
jgi:hypothetical protein